MKSPKKMGRKCGALVIGGFLLLGSVAVIKAETTSSVPVHSDQELYQALEGDAMISFESDIDLDSALTIQDGRTHTIDLNGYVLSTRGDNISQTNGSVIILDCNSKLVVKDSSRDKTGVITGGFADKGGGVLVSGGSKFHMTGGSIEGNYAQRGGGVYVAYGSEAVLSETRVSCNNSQEMLESANSGVTIVLEKKRKEFFTRKGMASGSEGGGVCVQKGGTCTLTECVVERNGATGGAGISSSGALDMIRGKVCSNDIIGPEYGGSRLGAGIFNEGEMTLDDVIINTNVDAQNGGGVANFGKLSLEDVEISNNSVTSKGGGIYSEYQMSDGRTVFSGDNKIVENSADLGGGAYIDKGTSKNQNNSFSRVKISDNHASGDGGGLYLGAGMKTTDLSNITMEGNSVDGSGGGVYARSAVKIIDCKLKKNSAKGKGGGVAACYDGTNCKLTITDTNISENICYEGGGGVWFQDKGLNARLHLGGGKTIIFSNKKCSASGGDAGDDNVCFKEFREIIVEGRFENDSMIGIRCEGDFSSKTFTKGYGDDNTKPIDTFFSYDGADYRIKSDKSLSEVNVEKKLAAKNSGYKAKIKITVTDDANVWKNTSYFELYGKGKNGTASSEKKLYSSGDITSEIDEGDDPPLEINDINCEDCFPTAIKFHTDFGNKGLVKRTFGADIELWVNGVNCGVMKVYVSVRGNTVNEGVADNKIEINKNKYPYFEEYQVTQKREIDLGKEDSKVVSIMAVDQYGVEMKPSEYTMENASFPGEDTAECLDKNGSKWKFDTSKTKECHSSVYVLKYKSGSSYRTWKEIRIGVYFRVPLYLTIKVGNEDDGYEQVDRLSGLKDEVLKVKIPSVKKGYKVGDDIEQKGVCFISNPIEDYYEVTLFTEDVELIFNTEPIKYKVVFDKNDDPNNEYTVSGRASSKTYYYDKKYTLPRTPFSSSEGFRFVGWNTSADGKGTAYTDGESVMNLTDKNGEIVTLYAQWEDESGNPVTASIFAKGAVFVGSGFAFLLTLLFIIINKKSDRGNQL